MLTAGISRQLQGAQIEPPWQLGIVGLQDPGTENGKPGFDICAGCALKTEQQGVSDRNFGMKWLASGTIFSSAPGIASAMASVWERRMISCSPATTRVGALMRSSGSRQ